MPESRIVAEIKIFQHSPDATAFEPGAVIFSEGDDGDVMYAVVEGEIELSRHGHRIESVEAGSIFGEMALIDSGARSATATAATTARVVPVDRNQFTYLVQEHPTFALQVMKLMAERLRNTNDAR